MKVDHRSRPVAISSLLVCLGMAACGGATRGIAPAAEAGVPEAGAPEAGAPDRGAATMRVIRGDPTVTDWVNLTVEAEGLSDLEGRLVKVRIGFPDRPPERLSSGEGHVAAGAFTFAFPASLQAFYYIRKLLFIDVDGDGVCAAGIDRVYTDSRATRDDLTLWLTDSVPAPPPEARMPRSFDAGGDCAVLNDAWPDE